MWLLILVVTLDGGTITKMPLAAYVNSTECIIAGMKMGPQYPNTRLQCVHPAPVTRIPLEEQQ